MKKLLILALLLWPSLLLADTTDATTDRSEIIYDKILYLKNNLGKRHATLISDWMERSIKNNKVPENFVLAITYFESSFNQGARGVKEEIGIMQIMPFWKKKKLCAGLKLWHGRDNIECGCRIYKYYADMFEGDWVFGVAGYNIGEAKVRWVFKHRRKQVIRFWYVKEVLKIKNRLDEYDKEKGYMNVPK